MQSGLRTVTLLHIRRGMLHGAAWEIELKQTWENRNANGGVSTEGWRKRGVVNSCLSRGVDGIRHGESCQREEGTVGIKSLSSSRTLSREGQG